MLGERGGFPPLIPLQEGTCGSLQGARLADGRRPFRPRNLKPCLGQRPSAIDRAQQVSRACPPRPSARLRRRGSQCSFSRSFSMSACRGPRVTDVQHHSRVCARARAATRSDLNPRVHRMGAFRPLVGTLWNCTPQNGRQVRSRGRRPCGLRLSGFADQRRNRSPERKRIKDRKGLEGHLVTSGFVSCVPLHPRLVF